MDAFIVDAVRTAGGRRNGRLANWHPADLGAAVLDALVARTGIDARAIDDVILGCVSQGGEQTFQIARNAVLASNLPETTPAVTIDRQCGSSQQAIQFAAQAVMSGTQDMVIAGGVESMSRVPIFSGIAAYEKAGLPSNPISPRTRARYGVEMFSQFAGAQMIADKHGFDREMLDAFALESHRRAADAIARDAFNNEIVPLDIGGEQHLQDEGVRFDASAEGTCRVEAAGGRRHDHRWQCQPDLRRRLGGLDLQRTHARRAWAEPVGTDRQPDGHRRQSGGHAGGADRRNAPRARTGQADHRDDIDLFEVNEAFASVPLAW